MSKFWKIIAYDINTQNYDFVTMAENEDGLKIAFIYMQKKVNYATIKTNATCKFIIPITKKKFLARHESLEPWNKISVHLKPGVNIDEIYIE
jgi:hypothetical protein